MAAAINSASWSDGRGRDQSWRVDTDTDLADGRSKGALSVGSSIVASAPTALNYSDTGGYTGTTADVGTLGSVANLSDALTGSMTIQVGSGIAQTIDVPPASDSSPTNNLSGLAEAINSLSIGVTAAVVTDSTTGLSSLQSLQERWVLPGR